MAFSLLVALAVGAALDVSDPWTANGVRPGLRVDTDDPWIDESPALDRRDPWASTRLTFSPGASPAAIDRGDPWAP